MFKSSQSQVFLALLGAIIALQIVSILQVHQGQEQQLEPKTEVVSSVFHQVQQDGTVKCLNPNCIQHMDPYELARDYQIDVQDEGATVWQGRRYVGFIPFNQTCTFNKIMMRDND